MGDVKEFETLPRHQLIFYKITSGSIAFSVKGDGHAVVGLAKKPGETCEYWIVIGDNECWLAKDGIHKSYLSNITNILSHDVYGRFWISWHSALLQFGKTSCGVPLISKKISTKDLQYVTFFTSAGRGRLLWKLYVPPKLPKLILKEVKNGNMEWIERSNPLPDGAFIGGYERELLYIMRALHHENGALTPGKFVPSEGLGYIVWLEEEKKANFEVLCGYNCIWVPACSRQIPIDAVVGGHLRYKDYNYYIGRAFEDGYLIPGKVMATDYHPVCYISYKGRKIAKKNYEILVDPTNSLRTNRQLVTHMENLAENRPKAESDDVYLLALRDNEDDEDSSESEPESE